MLLKKGDTWSTDSATGASRASPPSSPSSIGAYGTGARPTLATGNSSAFTAGGGPLDNVDIIGLKMFANARGGSGPDGINVDSKVNNFLIENCDIEGYGNNIVFQKYYGTMSNVTIRTVNHRRRLVRHRRPLRRDSSATAVTASPSSRTSSTTTAGTCARGGWMTIFNHDAYITANNSGLVAIGNTFSNASNFGLEARCGGIIENNLFYNDADGLDFRPGRRFAPSPPAASAVSSAATVFSGSHPIGGVTYGGGLTVGNINRPRRPASPTTSSPTTPSARSPRSSSRVGAGNPNAYSAVGLNNVTITRQRRLQVV